MAFGANDGPDGFDFAGFADEKRAANDAHESAPHEELLLPGTEGGDGFVVGIAEQRKIQLVLGLKGSLGSYKIGAHAKDVDLPFVELLLCVTKLGRLDGSTRGVGFGIEKEEDAAALEVLEGHGGAVVGGKAKGGGFVAGLEHGNECRKFSRLFTRRKR
jgi:hypothetical protein